jgi:hypothetical protein
MLELLNLGPEKGPVLRLSGVRAGCQLGTDAHVAALTAGEHLRHGNPRISLASVCKTK